jgi:acyl carrier protein
VTTENVENKIRDIIAEQLGIGSEEISPDAHFARDLGADRLDFIELVMAFEEEFDIEISDEDAENLMTLKSVVAFLGERS